VLLFGSSLASVTASPFAAPSPPAAASLLLLLVLMTVGAHTDAAPLSLVLELIADAAHAAGCG